MWKRFNLLGGLISFHVNEILSFNLPVLSGWSSHHKTSWSISWWALDIEAHPTALGAEAVSRGHTWVSNRITSRKVREGQSASKRGRARMWDSNPGRGFRDQTKPKQSAPGWLESVKIASRSQPGSIRPFAVRLCAIASMRETKLPTPLV